MNGTAIFGTIGCVALCYVASLQLAACATDAAPLGVPASRATPPFPSVLRDMTVTATSWTTISSFRNLLMDRCTDLGETNLTRPVGWCTRMYDCVDDNKSVMGWDIYFICECLRNEQVGTRYAVQQPTINSRALTESSEVGRNRRHFNLAKLSKGHNEIGPCGILAHTGNHDCVFWQLGGEFQSEHGGTLVDGPRGIVGAQHTVSYA